MARLSELNEMTAQNYDPSTTYLLAEGSGNESEKIKASTLISKEAEEREATDGDLSDLTTTAKTDLVSAINEVDEHADDNASAIGDLSDLTTTAKTDLVSALNECVENLNFLTIRFDRSPHNIPRWISDTDGWHLGKDITAYVTDGSIWKRLNGTDGFSLFEDIYAGDFFQMSRAITCPDSYNGETGSDWVTIAGINTLMCNGDTGIDYNHLVMVPGKGETGSQHFGRHAMNSSDTTTGGYKSSVMRTDVLGAVVSTGSTASGATINQQLYAEFGSHLKTTRELITNSINASGYNRFGDASGCSSGWEWSSEQAILMSEVEVYGSIVWSSSGYDTGVAKTRLPLFAHSTKALNNRSAYWWLKDIASAAYFCCVHYSGRASYDYASHSGFFVRPRFVLAA